MDEKIVIVDNRPFRVSDSLHSLYISIKDQDAVAVKKYLRTGNMNEQDLDMALILSAFEGYSTGISLFRGAGANVNAEKGKALRVAAKLGHTGALKELVAGLPPKACFLDDALEIAAVFGQPDAVKVLKKAGADPNVVSGKTRNWILSYGNPRIVALLEPDQKYMIQSKYVVTQDISIDDGDHKLKRIFDFHSSEVFTLSSDGGLFVQSFNDADKISVENAQAALKEYHRNRARHSKIQRLI